VLLILIGVGYWGLGRHPFLAAELLLMRRDDQRLRMAEISSGQPMDETQRIDRRNTARLKEIVDDYGWPTRSLVGRWGSHAAWLLVQHATHEPAFMELVLRLMEGAPPGDVDPHDVALLKDRLLVMDGEEQIYGTQFTCRDGQHVLSTPLVDPERVDELRAEAGMPTFEENRRRVEALYGPCDRP
jgi:hypothetical protein